MMAGIDPLTLAVVRHKLVSVAEEMVDTLIRTSFSPILNISHDLSAVILDGRCRLLSQAERVPIHMGAMPFAARAMAEAFQDDIGPGDVLMANDPYWGGNHLPDVTLARPVFRDGVLRLWVVNRAHHGDIGGLSAGGYSTGATEIFHEGLRIPPIRIVADGRVHDDMLRLVTQNTRKPDDMMGDLRAQIAAIDVGVERMEALFARYGAAMVSDCADAMLDGAEAAMSAQLVKWRDGVYEATGILDDDGQGNTNIPVHAKITLRHDRAVVDLTGSCDQLPSFVNSPYANTAACVLAAFMYLAEDEPVPNEGCFRCIELVTRKGSICDPVAPAAVVGSSVVTATAIMEAVLKAMAGAAPDAAIAGYARRFRFAIAGDDRDGRPYIWHYFSNRGGAGASRDQDGWSNIGVIHNPGAATSPSVERTEAQFPFFIESLALRPDSCGAGERRGGLGGIYRLRYEGPGPATLNATGEGVVSGPYGVAGGGPGAPHDYRIRQGGEDGHERPLGAKEAGLVLLPGDVLSCAAAGGGGFGDPRRRNSASLARDLADGHVSPAAADDYGTPD